MDNISHSLAGLVVGEIIHRSLPQELTPERNSLRRKLLLVTCAVASNFPDLDLVLTPLLPPPLGYLLHHRGHTHTLLYAFPQALLLGLILWLLWPAARRLLKEESTARKGFGLALVVGFSLHLLMDYLNSYGIHPFHPFDSRWLFGDMIFIIEPVFWIAFGVPMAITIQKRWLRNSFLALLIGAPLFFTVVGFLPWPSLLALILIAGLLGYVQKRSGAKQITGLILSAMIGVVFVALQSYASGLAKRTLIQELINKDNTSLYLDSVMSSFPSNPLCWTFISIESKESEGFYRMRNGVMSLAPKILPAAQCPSFLSEPLDEKSQSSAGLIFTSELKGDLIKLRELAANDCHLNAWLRFARAPLISETDASDIRFASRGSRGNFSTLRFEDFKDKECPRFVPQWGYPRADLLKKAAP